MTPSNRRIAIVEDDSALRESLSEAVTSTDHWQVVGSYGRAEIAIPAIQKEPPDIVITDIQLPGLS